MSLFVFFISLLIVAQHVSGNHVPIIRIWRLRDVIASCWYVPWLQGGCQVRLAGSASMDRGSTVVRCCATNRKVAGSIPAGVSEFFIDIKSFRSHYDPGFDSASNKNEYQEYFLGVNAAGAWSWQPYHHPVPLSWNLGALTSWNPLGHSRPVTGLLYLTLPTFMIPTDNASSDPSTWAMVLKGHHEVTVSMNIHIMNLRSS